jgi:hypothetical protein
VGGGGGGLKNNLYEKEKNVYVYAYSFHSFYCPSFYKSFLSVNICTSNTQKSGVGYTARVEYFEVRFAKETLHLRVERGPVPRCGR